MGNERWRLPLSSSGTDSSRCGLNLRPARVVLHGCVSPFVSARTSVTFTFDGCFMTAGKVANWLIDFCQLTLDDQEVTARLHLAAHELVDNALKYGTDDDMGLEFELSRQGRTRIVTLRTRNRTTPDQLLEVSRRIGELKRASDPLEYYDSLIRGTAPLSGQSGLGLARIRAEAGLEVDCVVQGPETVSIVVQATLNGDS
jgi:hypothetical protein